MCLRQGKPNKIIAHELGIRESTVKVFVHRILTKLRATNRTELAVRTGGRADSGGDRSGSGGAAPQRMA